MVLPKQEDLPILRDGNWLAASASDVSVLNSVDENACFCIDIELIIGEAEAHDVVSSIMLQNGIVLVILVPPIQIDPPIMQVGHNQQFPRAEVFLVMDDVGQLVVDAGLERSPALDLLAFFLQVEDIFVVVEQLVFFEVFFNVVLLLELDEIIPDFDDTVSIVDVALYEVIQVGLQPSYEFSVLRQDPEYDLVVFYIIDCDKLVSLVLLVLNSGEDYQPLPGVVNSKVEDFSPRVQVFIDLLSLISCEQDV
mmetsp:Transcript_7702/g.11943  ORF Transcript_7702/g.11943 Transcript_7702/m.11943 type:complete len:251 (+) Transcript_7702:2604-3356(+)